MFFTSFIDPKSFQIITSSFFSEDRWRYRSPAEKQLGCSPVCVLEVTLIKQVSVGGAWL